MSAIQARLAQQISHSLDREYGVPASIHGDRNWPLAERIAAELIQSGIIREIHEDGMELARSDNQYHRARSQYPKGPVAA